MNLIPSTVPEAGFGLDPTINALDAPYAVTPLSASVAISQTQGFLPITKAGIAALTLALPVAGLPSAGGNDGQVLTIVSTTAYAHTITTPSDGLLGALHIVTFTPLYGAYLRLIAYNGSWWLLASSGVSLS